MSSFPVISQVWQGSLSRIPISSLCCDISFFDNDFHFFFQERKLANISIIVNKPKNGSWITKVCTTPWRR